MPALRADAPARKFFSAAFVLTRIARRRLRQQQY
jgi:hypothetical protein